MHLLVSVSLVKCLSLEYNSLHFIVLHIFLALSQGLGLASDYIIYELPVLS